jgi:hypothetical protein
MDMVARVADAILKRLIAEQEYLKDLGDGLIKYDGYIYLSEVAKAAIEAMREPTEAMADAFSRDIDDWFAERIEDPMHLYKVAIDAALKEHEGTGR